MRLAVCVNAFRVYSMRLALESKRVYSQLAASETCTGLCVVSRGHALTLLGGPRGARTYDLCNC